MGRPVCKVANWPIAINKLWGLLDPGEVNADTILYQMVRTLVQRNHSLHKIKPEGANALPAMRFKSGGLHEAGYMT
jgi:hypothetical protein